jgi:hypothetical protein
MNCCKNLLLLFFCVFTCSCVIAQERKDLTISAGAGWMSTPNYYRSKIGSSYLLDFDYQLTRKSALSYNFTTGRQRYQDTLYKITSPSGYYMYGDSTNAEIRYYNFALSYKYNLFSTRQLSAAAGVGLALSVIDDTRPFFTINSAYPLSNSYIDLVFPIRLEIDYRLNNHFKAGIYGGTFIQPDYPFMGNHAGLRIGYTIR